MSIIITITPIFYMINYGVHYAIGLPFSLQNNATYSLTKKSKEMMSTFGGVNNMLNAFLTSHILMCISMSVSTSTAEREVIYNIGAAHCPCLKFCNDRFRTINYNRTDYQKNDQFISDDKKNDQFVNDDQTNDQFVFDDQTYDQFVFDDQANDQFVFDDQANDQFVHDYQKNNQSVSDYQKNDQFASDEENDSICEDNDVYTPQKHGKTLNV